VQRPIFKDQVRFAPESGGIPKSGSRFSEKIVLQSNVQTMIRFSCLVGLGRHYRRNCRRLGYSRGFQGAMGRGRARPMVPVHRFRLSSAGRDPENTSNFFKNLTMAAGFLYVVAYGAGAMSVDASMSTGKA
jgi:hypothetical protein